VRIEMLIMRTPLPGGGAPGEIVLRKGTLEQMLPHFIATQLSWGAAGTILAALLAGAMSSIDSGLNAICSLLVTDLHRRFGWGRTWLARRRGKPVASLTEIDELALARPLTLIIGLAATAFSIAVAQIADIFSIMVSVANTFGAPLLAVFLLGMLTRRTTAAAALLALLLGSAATLGFTAVNKLAAAGVVIPRAYAIAEIWTVIVGVLATLAIGYLASFVLGKRKSPAELRGLVAGCGRLGTRAIDETVPIFS
jgi:Na+/proline symporter